MQKRPAFFVVEAFKKNLYNVIGIIKMRLTHGTKCRVTSVLQSRLRTVTMAKEYKFKGYTFYTEAEMLEAKKESEAIEYLKAKTDFNNLEVLVKLYNRTIDRKIIITPVGLDFLKDLRNRILKSEFVTEDKLMPLPDIKKSKPVKPKLTKVQKLENTNRLLKLTVFLMSLLIVAMFIISIFGKNSPIAEVQEKKVLDRYAAWQQELDEREQKLNDILYYLEENGIKYPENQGE